MTEQIPMRPIAAAVATRLAGVANATGWVGQISARTGLPGVTDTPDGPLAKSPEDPRVQPYFVLFPGIGSLTGETNLSDTSVDVDVPVTVTAAAGDIDDLLALVVRINTVLDRWSPGGIGWFVQDPETFTWTWAADPGDAATVRRVVTGPLRIRPGVTPQVLLDEQVDPARHFTRLDYVLTAHT